MKKKCLFPEVTHPLKNFVLSGCVWGDRCFARMLDMGNYDSENGVIHCPTPLAQLHLPSSTCLVRVGQTCTVYMELFSDRKGLKNASLYSDTHYILLVEV